MLCSCVADRSCSASSGAGERASPAAFSTSGSFCGSASACICSGCRIVSGVKLSRASSTAVPATPSTSTTTRIIFLMPAAFFLPVLGCRNSTPCGMGAPHRLQAIKLSGFSAPQWEHFIVVFSFLAVKAFPLTILGNTIPHAACYFVFSYACQKDLKYFFRKTAQQHSCIRAVLGC